MNFVWSFRDREFFITPAIGIINEKYYYGYPVFALAFAWLNFRCKIEFGVRRSKRNDRHTDF